MAEIRTADPSLFRSPQRISTVDTVIGKIRNLLLGGQLRPGDRLPNEIELTKSLSASRGSIREAMKVLSSFGILEIKRGDGTYVSQSPGRRLFDHLLFQLILSNADRQAIIQLRELLEMGIIKIVVQKATDDDIGHIESAHLQMKASIQSGESDPTELTRQDIAFHVAMVRATKNELIETIYSFTLELFEPSIRRTHERELVLALAIHEEILDGIKSRDLEKSYEAIRRSIERWVALS